MSLLILLLLVIPQIPFSVNTPTHRIHIRWAVDLDNPAPSPTSEDNPVDNSADSVLLWFVLLIQIITVVLCFLCLYPFRDLIWYSLTTLLAIRPQRTDDAMEMTSLENTLNMEASQPTGTRSLVTEGRDESPQVQATLGEICTLVYVLVNLAVPNKDSKLSASTPEE